VLAEVTGFATLADSYHPSSPDPAGTWEARAMRLALDDAGAAPEQVSALIAHATATPKGDAAEIAAINTVYRPRRSSLPVTSLKGHLGHTGAASGAMSIMAAAHAMRTGSFPNTAGTRDVDPAAEFDVVTAQPVTVEVDVVQVNAFGFGGQDTSVVIRRPAEPS
jgi:3-oxoacyl-[acyl-carrier-protein] synthase II